MGPAAGTALNANAEKFGGCCTCGSTNRNWGYIHADGKYSCHGCCYRNKAENGFYGPLGTRSRAELDATCGSRACAECGTRNAHSWRGHKMVRQGRGGPLAGRGGAGGEGKGRERGGMAGR